MSNLMDLLIMFHEIHRLKREGFSNAWIARHLVLNRRTIKKYLHMSEEEYLSYKDSGQPRMKLLAPYEDFVRIRLEECPDASAAQVHDWLKEHFDDLVGVNEKTVFNFVLTVRNKYDIPKLFHYRDFGKIEELPYGKQAQVDFGEYNMTTDEGTRKKVYFFVMVLSTSRQNVLYTVTDHLPHLPLLMRMSNVFSFLMALLNKLYMIRINLC